MIRQIRLFASVIALICTAAMPAHAGKRVALVVGNGAYAHMDRLATPAAGARDIANALQGLGFRSTTVTDADGAGFRKGLEAFEAAVGEGDLAAVVILGRCVNTGGDDVYLPVDAPAAASSDAGTLEAHGIALSKILDLLARRKVGASLLFVDSCPGLPGPKAASASGGGTPRDLFLMFSAAAGQAPIDQLRPGDAHSPFVEVLLSNLATPEQDMQKLAKRVTGEVAKVTGAAGRMQAPRYYSRMTRPLTLAE